MVPHNNYRADALAGVSLHFLLCSVLFPLICQSKLIHIHEVLQTTRFIWGRLTEKRLQPGNVHM